MVGNDHKQLVWQISKETIKNQRPVGIVQGLLKLLWFMPSKESSCKQAASMERVFGKWTSYAGVQQARTGSLAGVSSSQKATGEVSARRPHRQEHCLVCTKVWRPGLCIWMSWQLCGKRPIVSAQPYHMASYSLWGTLKLKSLIQQLVLHRASLKIPVVP